MKVKMNECDMAKFMSILMLLYSTHAVVTLYFHSNRINVIIFLLLNIALNYIWQNYLPALLLAC